ncbi:MAG: glycosyltransferase family 2 protein [Proteobacteria bacterium]|nr:glycosyltransferase family 2 protein [Pseudomonadota bacterium]
MPHTRPRCLINVDHLLGPAGEAPRAARAAGALGAELERLAARADTVLLTRHDAPALQQTLARLAPAAGAALAVQPRWRAPAAGEPVPSIAVPASDGTLFVVSAQPADLAWAANLPGETQDAIPVLLWREPETAAAPAIARLAWYVGRTLDEAVTIVVARRRELSLSVVLMAYDEAASITAAITEVRRFCQRFVTDYEIIVVDDGSRDATAELARRADEGDVQVLRHAQNQGMGDTLRDGFAAARCDFLTALPADRQVRAQSLAPFLPHLAANVCVHGQYIRPHAGPGRQVLTWGLRALLRHVGDLRVDFAGAYAFHRHWRDRVDLQRLPSHSFVFSFELLDALTRHGCAMTEIPMLAFPREAGSSREARAGRIAKVAQEVVRSRLLRAFRD